MAQPRLSGLTDVHAARHAAGLHVVGQRDVVRPDVELPLAEAEHAAENGARVHADTHVYRHLWTARGSQQGRGADKHAERVTEGTVQVTEWLP